MTFSAAVALLTKAARALGSDAPNVPAAGPRNPMTSIEIMMFKKARCVRFSLFLNDTCDEIA